MEQTRILSRKVTQMDLYKGSKACLSQPSTFLIIEGNLTRCELD